MKSERSFYLNNDFVSKLLDVDHNLIQPIDNDWQSTDAIPFLKNHLDVLTKKPGIFPAESIAQFDKPKLHPFFTRLPQHSQINEQCITPYYPPGSDLNL
jgi:hypothetical protein